MPIAVIHLRLCVYLPPARLPGCNILKVSTYLLTLQKQQSSDNTYQSMRYLPA
ncbi:uncharacterized protein P174DRAFT_441686 [Aspergillus novofumigatus IBT 16806]|uniref:Uncharacterized protein n=1 Tax=Aspergillus novofumigatus (strain IBT 16806) TaxID=1392255 RepID=A0A2I1C9T9_ASPN1|nr:uncharacterized protein P174DRAFT_441686 [Aspergillus novofumigatus IBT 16806]PKX94400.1 hypothetical protein P174DRAFT_441686 [Aspergillus novofumigatus IBT 16806]